MTNIEVMIRKRIVVVDKQILSVLALSGAALDDAHDIHRNLSIGNPTASTQQVPLSTSILSSALQLQPRRRVGAFQNTKTTKNVFLSSTSNEGLQ
jgi:hypothetical protein